MTDEIYLWRLYGMEYNIDILVAGCNTTCMHCYVNGGKAPIMNMDDFHLCINKLSPVFDKLKESIGFTLDNELFNHPNAVEILECVERTCKNNYFHHGSTTGIAFLNHPKQTELLEILKRNNWNSVSFAVHGNHETHNQIVNHTIGLESILKACKLFKENDFEVWISLIITKKLVNELDDVASILAQIEYDSILPVIPDYFPTTRLNKYQNIRCNKDEYEQIIEFLVNRKVDVSDIKNAVELYNEETIIQNLNVGVVKGRLTSKNTTFFHIDHKLDFYLGNTGAALKYLGNIKALSSDEIYDCIISAEDNFFETATIHYEDIISAISNNRLERSKENYVYPTEIAGMIAMMNNKEIFKFYEEIGDPEVMD